MGSFSSLFVRYFVGLLLGTLVGFLLVDVAPVWFLVVLLLIAGIIEAAGHYSHKSRWIQYRVSHHVFKTGFATFVILGILLSGGHVGRFLIEFGTLIS